MKKKDKGVPSALTDDTRLSVLAEIEKNEAMGAFDSHTDPVDYSMTLPVDENFPYIRKGFRDKTRVFLQRIFIVYPFAKKQSKNLGTRVVGKERMKGIRSAILTCNHINKFDCLAIQHAMMPRRTYVVGAEFNNVKGFFGEMMRVGGMLPLSNKLSAQKNFMKAVSHYLKKKCFVLIYPEQAMWWMYEKPRPMKDGAFVLAMKNSVPIVPMFITFRHTGVFDANGIEQKDITLNIMDPIYPREDLSYRENIEYLRRENERVCREKYIEVYGKEPTYSCEGDPFGEVR